MRKVDHNFESLFIVYALLGFICVFIVYGSETVQN